MTTKSSATTVVTAVDTTVARTVSEARPTGNAKHGATTGAGEARPPEIAKYTTVAKSIGDGVARPPGSAKCSVMTEAELAESSDEESSDEAGFEFMGDCVEADLQ